MGSKFKRKKKPEFGDMSLAIDDMQRDLDEKNVKLGMLLEITCQLKEITYYLLHEEFGYGKKRITRVDVLLEGYLNYYYCHENGFTPKNIADFEIEKLNLNPKEIAKRVPMAYKQQLAHKYLPKKLKHNTKENMRIISQCIELFMTFAILAMLDRHTDKNGHHVRSLSANKIKLIVDKYVMYTDIMTKPNKYGLTISDIQKSLKDDLDIDIKRFEEAV